LIEQLLTLARYESGSLVPVIREIDLCSSVRYCIERMRDSSASAEINLVFDDTGTINVKADPSMLDVILENLFSNAIKYSGTSTRIDISVTRAGKEVSLAIRDYGIGMQQEQLARVFDRFYRSDEARSSQIGGHGIGLAIVKRLADVQNIAVKFESELSKGTTATLQFQ
jgi:two-component system, OmpR family, heavy metal sensor histidine kinase CusS